MWTTGNRNGTQLWNVDSVTPWSVSRPLVFDKVDKISFKFAQR
jgi:hypothetical protein